jgi:possible lipoprotein
MRKLMISFLTGASILSLVACAPKRYERQSKPNTASSSLVKKEKKDTGQKNYQEVLDRYKAYAVAITAQDQTALQNELKKIDATSEEYAYVFNLQTLGSTNEWHYAFWDLNQDGSDELLIGDVKTIAAVYYLKDKQPTLLHVAYVASAGGYRSSLEAYDNGQLAYASWQSTQPEMELILYSLEKGEAKEEKKATIQIGGKETVEQALGISAKKLELTKLDWKKIASEDKAQTTAKTEEKKFGSFQVQVSVADLRIRKEPSTSAPSAGMIAKGIHTITETVEADGHTWGKLESGQGWIALEFTSRVSGNAESASAPAATKTGMNLEEIKAGNFSSVAGVWKNKHGTSIEFDAQGIVKVNGSALTGVQFSEFYFKEGNLHGLSRMPGATNETPILFIPSREGGSESIYWSKSDVTNGNDLYYRVN